MIRLTLRRLAYVRGQFTASAFYAGDRFLCFALEAPRWVKGKSCLPPGVYRASPTRRYGQEIPALLLARGQNSTGTTIRAAPENEGGIRSADRVILIGARIEINGCRAVMSEGRVGKARLYHAAQVIEDNEFRATNQQFEIQITDAIRGQQSVTETDAFGVYRRPRRNAKR